MGVVPVALAGIPAATVEQRIGRLQPLQPLPDLLRVTLGEFLSLLGANLLSLSKCLFPTNPRITDRQRDHRQKQKERHRRSRGKSPPVAPGQLSQPVPLR